VKQELIFTGKSVELALEEAAEKLGIDRDKLTYEVIEQEKTGFLGLGAGLAKVKVPARFEVLSVLPTIIADSTYKVEAVETVCESLFDFSELTGREIALCLPPDVTLINKYLDMLTARGYKIDELYTICDDEKKEALAEALPKINTVTAAKTAKALAKQTAQAKSQERILLISGAASFTSAIRLEIMRKLQF
jgi:predicted RNA-binding protein Jag